MTCSSFLCLVEEHFDPMFEMASGVWSRPALAAAATAALSILSTLHFCYSDQAPNYTFLKQATDSPPITRYDYIIVGGGTAGCPLAATLSQRFTVLLLERGGSPYGNQNISNLSNFSQTLSDTSPSSASQRFVSTDGVLNSRARVLGGGSCLNAGFYSRADPAYVRAAGWDGRLANDSYAWAERTVAFEPPMLQWQSAVRDGLLEAGVGPYNGFTYDHVYGTKVGGTIFDRAGHRHSAADLLEDARPEGITVLLHATVSRILFRLKGKPRPTAHGVVFRDARGVEHRAYLSKGSHNEIIISAGAMGSPQLLMLSGIGPEAHLQSLGINVLLDNPAVGQGMADNSMNAIYVPSPLPVETSLIQVVGITNLGTYIEAASGSLFTAGQLSSNSLSRGGFLLEKIVGPLSTGHLELANRNPDDNPTVTFNYFKEPEDLRRCVAGIRIMERVIESKAFSKFRFPFLSLQTLLNMTASFPINLRPRHGNDSTSLEQFCKDTVMTIWHYHGGCQVGRVVDHAYRVIGVDALRVIDGSTFNHSPGTNPQATVMMLGRYMGVTIQTERLKFKRSDSKG